MPPEQIAAGSTVQFGSYSNAWIGPSVEGTVVYETLYGGKVQITWENPFGFWKSEAVKFVAAKPGNIRGKSVRRAHGKGYLLESKCTVALLDSSKTLSPPPRPKSKSRPVSGNQAAQPLTWKEKVFSAHRGMFITVTNATDVRMTLASEMTDGYSQWGQKPAGHIAPSGKDTFGAHSTVLNGASGTVRWNIQGCEKDVLLIFSNPYFGENTIQAQCPDQFRFTVKGVDRSCSGIIAVLSRKSNAFQELLRPNEGTNESLEDFEDMEWSTLVAMSKTKVRLDVKKETMLKLLSMACTLVPPPLSATCLSDPYRRAQQLAKLLQSSPFDVICLQEVFWGAARQLLSQKLVKNFPHIIDKAGKEAYGVGVQSGLFVASKHPIEWSQFFPFEEGIGSCSLASKGALLVKIKAPSGSYYIVCTDMQTDPDDSVSWKLVSNAKSRAVEVRRAQVEMISKMLSQKIVEREKEGHVCLVLAGRMQITAERRKRSEQEHWATTSLIPHLADLLNNGKVPVVFVSELLSELKARGFHMRFLAKLRAVTVDRRMRSLLLIVMIAKVLQKEIWVIMSETVFSDSVEEEKFYIRLCLSYYESVMGIAPTIEIPKPKKMEGETQSSSGEEGKEQESPKEKPRLLNNIWDQELLHMIVLLFGQQAVSEEELNGGSGYLKAEVIWFQLLRYLEDVFGVALGADVEMELLKEGARSLSYPDDVAQVDSDLRSRNARLGESIEDDKLQIERTEEFSEALKVLGEPRDVFRECNPKDFGSDITPVISQMLGLEECRKDLILLFDRLPEGKKNLELVKMEPLYAARLLLMGDSGAMSDALTFSPGVETILSKGDSGMEDFLLVDK